MNQFRGALISNLSDDEVTEDLARRGHLFMPAAQAARKKEFCLRSLVMNERRLVDPEVRGRATGKRWGIRGYTRTTQEGPSVSG